MGTISYIPCILTDEYMQQNCTTSVDKNAQLANNSRLEEIYLLRLNVAMFTKKGSIFYTVV